MSDRDIDWNKEWDKGKAALRSACIDVARRRETSVPRDFYSLLHEGHRDLAHFYQMMREISDEENAQGRGYLGAVIVMSNRQPGEGFLNFLVRGRGCTDSPLDCWERERDTLFAYWSSHPNEA